MTTMTEETTENSSLAESIADVLKDSVIVKLFSGPAKVSGEGVIAPMNMFSGGSYPTLHIHPLGNLLISVQIHGVLLLGARGDAWNRAPSAILSAVEDPDDLQLLEEASKATKTFLSRLSHMDQLLWSVIEATNLRSPFSKVLRQDGSGEVVLVSDCRREFFEDNPRDALLPSLEGLARQIVLMARIVEFMENSVLREEPILGRWMNRGIVSLKPADSEEDEADNFGRSESNEVWGE